MSQPEDRAPFWALWLLIAFAAVQPLIWLIAGPAARQPVILVPLILVWVALLILAAIGSRTIGSLGHSLASEEKAHRETLRQVEQLRTQNAMLEIITRSGDVPLAFQELACRIVRLVPCDRVGLALLSEDGKEFRTFTARTHENSEARRDKPEIVFRVERTMIGSVVRSREPLLVPDLNDLAADYLDVNVVFSAGFRSALVIPLISQDRAVGTLNVVARRPNAFDRGHLEPLQAIAEKLAVTWVAQQLQITLGKYRMVEVLSDAMLSIATEINSALQTIIGTCEILERTTSGAGIRGDLNTIVQQAQRISELLVKMRTMTNERLKEASHSIYHHDVRTGTGDR